jgi:Ni,Fe-hydrogenase III component G
MESHNPEAELKALFPEGAVTFTPPKTFWVDVEASQIRAAFSAVREKLGIGHLSTIVGEDMRDHFLVTYILSGAVVVVLKVKLDHERPEVPSLTPICPGAAVYEREMHDLLGILPLEHPTLHRQVLPEDWPAGLYPLRKGVTLPRASAAGDDGEGNHA